MCSCWEAGQPECLLRCSHKAKKTWNHPKPGWSPVPQCSQRWLQGVLSVSSPGWCKETAPGFVPEGEEKPGMLLSGLGWVPACRSRTRIRLSAPDKRNSGFSSWLCLSGPSLLPVPPQAAAGLHTLEVQLISQGHSKMVPSLPREEFHSSASLCWIISLKFITCFPFLNPTFLTPHSSTFLNHSPPFCLLTPLNQLKVSGLTPLPCFSASSTPTRAGSSPQSVPMGCPPL